jgi:UDP-N-acetylmuramyl pentapeptide phosphotransferase/UDP-N-acetylglucosamine-1-phosphate transferase
LTAGSLKMVAGPAVAIIVVAPVSNDSAVRLVLDGALVALAANLANLFDRAPGRVTKVSLVMAALLVGLTGGAPELLGLAVVSGAALALLVPDLRERMMLGDAGANPLGATLGLAAVLTVSPAARNGILVVVLVLNLVSERVSFSRVIDRVAPLRVLDRAGRRRSGDA